MVLVSIIIPTYNRASYLLNCLNSLFEQTFIHFEIVVVDDGSSDDTHNILTPYLDRIQYIYQENQERSIARNNGANHAQGKYLLFLDSDDLLLPTALEQLVGEIEANPDIGLVTGGWQEIDAQGEFLHERRPWQTTPELTLHTLLRICPFPPSAALMRQEWFHRVNGFDPELPPIEDADLWVRLAYAGCPMRWLKKPVYQYRQHAGNSITDVARRRQSLKRSLEKFYAQPDLSLPLRATQDQVWRQAYARIISFSIASNSSAEMIVNALDEAVTHHPAYLDSDSRYLFDLIAGQVANNLEIIQPQQYLKALFIQFPPFLFPLRKRKLLGMATMGRFFLLAQNKEWSQARRFFWQSIGLYPQGVCNLGALSLFGESLLGHRVMSCLRRLVSPLITMRRVNDARR